MFTSTILLPIIAAFLVTVVLTGVFLPLIKKVGLFDDPKKHKHPAMLHRVPIPRGGGLPFFLGIFVVGLFFVPITPITIALFTAGGISLVVGLLDDKYDLSPYVRFLINIICAVIVIASGVDIAFITNPITPGVFHFGVIALPFGIFGVKEVLFSHVISLLWIVWVMNMLNWSKGVDGQMPGVVAISAIIIGLLSLRFPLSDVDTHIAASLSFVIAGASIGFLFYNFYPAKIFPGYGATAIYLLLAAVSILSSAKLATAILVMGVPMIDGLFSILRRILTGHSPFRHDKKHLHHLLLGLGLGQRSIALFYWIFSAIVGAISLTLTSSGKLFAIIMLGVIVGGALLFLHFFLRFRNQKNGVSHF